MAGSRSVTSIGSSIWTHPIPSAASVFRTWIYATVSLGNKGRSDLSVGMRVFHQKFGYGAIAEIEGNKLEIDFEMAGRKRVMDSFVTVA